MTAKTREARFRPWPRVWITMALMADGALRIEGQDLREGEYEYVVTVRTADLPAVRQALGGGPEDDLLTLLKRHGHAIIERGELAWLHEQGITPQFWSRREG